AVTAIVVHARHADEHGRLLTPLGQGAREQSRALHPALMNLPLLPWRPHARDRLAGEVHDGVHAFELRRLDLPLLWMPDDDALARRYAAERPDHPHDLVPPRSKRLQQRPPYHPARSR